MLQLNVTLINPHKTTVSHIPSRVIQMSLFQYKMRQSQYFHVHLIKQGFMTMEMPRVSWPWKCQCKLTSSSTWYRFCLDHNYAMFQCSNCNHIASNKKQIKSTYARYFEHLLKPNSLRRILGRLKFNLYMYLYKQYGSLFF